MIERLVNNHKIPCQDCQKSMILLKQHFPYDHDDTRPTTLTLPFVVAFAKRCIMLENIPSLTFPFPGALLTDLRVKQDTKASSREQH